MPQISVDRMPCFYSLVAPGSRAPEGTLVLLHGSGGDSSAWESQAAGLGRTRRLVIPDLPGHGSSAGAALSIEAAAVWLKQFVLCLELPPFVLVGHSLGSAIALEFARANPRIIQGLVLAAAGQRLPVPPEYLRLVQDDFEAAIAVSCSTAYAPGAPPGLARRGRDMLQSNGQAALYSDLLACAAFDSSAWVNSVALPTLVMCGSDDKITGCQGARELACRLPRGSLQLIPGAGHMLMAEAPEEFNAALQHFIRTGTVREAASDQAGPPVV